MLNDSSGVVLARLADIERKLQKSPQNYDLWTNKGVLLRQLKRYEEALSAFDTATQMSTNAAVAWKQKSEVLAELKRYDEALTAITRAILAFPWQEEYYLAKKEIVKLQNGESNEEELRAAYGEVLSINRFLVAPLRGNHIPSPFVGEGRVRGHNYGPYSTDTSQLAAG